MTFNQLFPVPFPIIGCVHLKALPGAPLYGHDMQSVFESAMRDAEALVQGGVHGLIIENFNDSPFYKDAVPSETVAAMAIATQKIKSTFELPVGVNVLRNDADSALGIAAASGADFIRVNIHMHAMVTDQGIIEGKSYDTLRKRSSLAPDVMIFADINVKHASPLVAPDIAQWVDDLTNRGKADAIIVSGSGTGKTTSTEEITIVKSHTHIPVLIGSGLTANNAKQFSGLANGAIVGSYLKTDGLVSNPVDVDRVKDLMTAIK